MCIHFSCKPSSGSIQIFTHLNCSLFILQKTNQKKKKRESCIADLLRSPSHLGVPCMSHAPPCCTTDVWEAFRSDGGCSPTHFQNAFGNNVLHFTGLSCWMKLEGNNASSLVLFVFVSNPVFSLIIFCVQSSMLKMTICWFSRLTSRKLAKYILLSTCETVLSTSSLKDCKDKVAHPSSSDGLLKDDLLLRRLTSTQCPP